MTNDQITAAVARLVNFAIESKETQDGYSEQLAWVRDLTGPRELTHLTQTLVRVVVAMSAELAAQREGYTPNVAVALNALDLGGNPLPAQLVLHTGPESRRIV